ncbi:hypothetical protein SISNIDRAFT_448897 [Sistotremastrum niveocremeum HHB9708]|uniref:peptidylprolyl isomerase n=2 Tax=Sistotremastraceae TaxID=3402574 RepID=A0A165A8G6_9AGAM|nr:hypothetical protein SISNIDRAFT_448897 [Sistotremastrum niveocremeum HHB9708]KZT42555.1 hypothetical protein SISSUDRAFT_1041531 [Sistotremastrum suecicum HHB10207 ss-3]
MLFNWLTLALLPLAALAADAPKELVIDVIHKPDDCKLTAQTGDKISVHYTGTLHSNGNKFDSSVDRGTPFDLTLGVGQVIKGWDEGLQGMCIKEKRKLTIPADKAYGSRGFGNVIPANSVLVFDVEMMGITPKSGRSEL